MIFIAKWLVGMISAVYDQHSPLMLVLCGKKQNTGKTEFFRRLLPKEIRMYYAESKLDAGKDDEILMCMKLMIMDDEFGGKSKRELSRLKELTSKQTFSLREPYGRNNVDLNRLAVLCGTSNEDSILSDPTGNRRIIPINVTAIDHTRYNSIDKVRLIMEAYHLYHEGFQWEMTRDDIALLNTNTTEFESVSMEEELVFKYFKLTEPGDQSDMFTTSDIVTHIDSICHTKLFVHKVGQILAKNDQQRLNFYRNGIRVKGYKLTKLEPESVKYVKNEDSQDYNVNIDKLPF
jgi:predicted P-loop ATPase